MGRGYRTEGEITELGEKQIRLRQNRNSLEEVMNKVWVLQHIENQYIRVAEPLEDFENILIEDINILKKHKTIIQEEIPVIATTKTETFLLKCSPSLCEIRKRNLGT